MTQVLLASSPPERNGGRIDLESWAEMKELLQGLLDMGFDYDLAEEAAFAMMQTGNLNEMGLEEAVDYLDRRELLDDTSLAELWQSPELQTHRASRASSIASSSSEEELKEEGYSGLACANSREPNPLGRENPDEGLCCVCGEGAEEGPLETFECGHRMCHECLYGMLQADINDNRMAKDEVMGCPLRSEGCSHRFSHCEILHWLDVVRPEGNTALKDKYERFVSSNRAQKNPNARWCLRPGCENFTIGQPSTRLVVCHTCGARQCFQCRGEYHPWWRPCRNRSDETVERWAQGKPVQNCPRCGMRTEKMEGCNHMSCVCGYEYCWVCRGPHPCPTPHPFAQNDQPLGPLAFRLDTIVTIAFAYLILLLLLLAMVIVPVLLIMLLVFGCFVCLPLVCCKTESLDWITESSFAEVFFEISLAVGVVYLVIGTAPIFVLGLTACSVTLATLLLPLVLTYLPFSLIAMLRGDSTCCIPVKHQPASAQPPRPGRSVVTTWYARGKKSDCMRRYVAACRWGMAALWFSVTFPLSCVVCVVLIPVAPLLLLPRVVVGRFKAPLCIALCLSLLVGAGTFSALYWWLKVELMWPWLTAIAAGATGCTYILLSPPNSNQFYFLAPLWYVVICPVTTVLHGWEQAEQAYSVFGPVDLKQLPLLLDLFRCSSLTSGTGNEWRVFGH